MIQITGKVIGGQKFGRVLGFPTANLDRRQYLREKMKVKFGVWAGEAVIGQLGNWAIGRKKSKTDNPKSGVYKAAIVIGPIDKTGRPKIEAHILGINRNLYGKKISITLKKYLRPFIKYKNIGDLKKQIGKDILEIKKLKD